MPPVKSRLPGLDLSRALCALIVFLGHFLIQDQHFSINPNSILFKVLDLRHFVVFYFFLLSGYVLKRSLKNQPAGIGWFKNRIIRLYPVYFVCWLGPYLGLRVLGSSEIQITNSGAFLGFFGLQGWSKKHALDGPNSPLWSLSVEFGLSLLFIIFSRIPNTNLLLLITAAIHLISIHFHLIPVFTGLPFFLLGINLYQRQTSLNKISRHKLAVLFLMALTSISIYLVFISPLDALFNLKEYFGLLCAGLLLISFLILPIPEKLWSLCHYLGSRSFSLYACHAPVLWLFKRIVFGAVNGNFIQPAGFMYFFGGVLIVFAVTEIIYRIVDIQATNVSKRFRSDSSS